MPIDYQPPPFSLIQPKAVESFDSICTKALEKGDIVKVNFRIREFSTDEYIMNYPPAEVSYTIAKLRLNNMCIDFGTDMDNKYCKDYILIKAPEVELRAKAEKL